MQLAELVALLNVPGAHAAQIRSDTTVGMAVWDVPWRQVDQTVQASAVLLAEVNVPVGHALHTGAAVVLGWVEAYWPAVHIV